MKLSTRGRYGIHAMYDLAVHYGDGPQSIKCIAERQGIPEAYLEQLIAVLRREKLVISNRGAQGGYRLAKEPENYTVGSILRLTEGDLAPVACLAGEENRCERCGECPTLDFWTGLYATVNAYIDRYTLADLLEEQRRKQGTI